MRTNLILLLMLVATSSIAQSNKNRSSVDQKRKPSRPIYITVEEMPVFNYKENKSTKKSFNC